MAKYSHRNGETEPPTIEGYYWFAGGEDAFSADDPGNWIDGLFYVKQASYGGRTRWDMDGEGHAFQVDEMSGRWWGPVTLPWEGGE